MKRLTQEDYDKLAKELKLEALEPAPPSVLTPLDWRCIICGRVHRRSYNKLRYMTIGCRCQSEVGKKPDDYHRLASRLGLRWVGKKLPQTVHHETHWASFNGDLFSAPYHELGYKLTRIPARYLSYFPPRVRQDVEDALAVEREERANLAERRKEILS